MLYSFWSSLLTRHSLNSSKLSKVTISKYGGRSTISSKTPHIPIQLPSNTKSCVHLRHTFAFLQFHDANGLHILSAGNHFSSPFRGAVGPSSHLQGPHICSPHMLYQQSRPILCVHRGVSATPEGFKHALVQEISVGVVRVLLYMECP